MTDGALAEATEFAGCSDVLMTARKQSRPTSISLFSGAGGLDIGLVQAGFRVNLCVEIDQEARATIKRNSKWTIATPGDIFALDAASIADQSGLDDGKVDLLHGGPPCQPFSKSGLWVNGKTSSMTDPRAASLKAYLRIVEAFRPRVILLENVEGIASGRANTGLEHFLAGLRRINTRRGTNYVATVHKLNALDYGVAQRRIRLFIVASRDGYAFQPSAPARDGLYTLGARTAWDAIGDLDTDDANPELRPTGQWADLLPSIPEGENYLWHTPQGRGAPLFGWRTRYWSFLLKLAKREPSWTIQASPGPATGPFHWKSRKLSIRELARIQTFPDDYEFCGEYRDALRQIGNAVPPALAEYIGRAILKQYYSDPRPIELHLATKHRGVPPAAERLKPIPKRHSVRNNRTLAPHPGVGKGPRAVRIKSAQNAK